MNLKSVGRALAAALAIAAPVLFSVPAVQAKEPGSPPDCLVPSAGYPTIQSAVDDPQCEVIGVAAGTFRENVAIDRNVTVRGAGAQRTTVDGSGSPNSVFRITGAYTSPCGEPGVAVALEAMTITGGTGPSCPSETPFCANRNGGGIGASPGTALTVRGCIIAGNSAYENGGGISVPNGRLTVLDSVVSGNTAFANPRPGALHRGGGGLRIGGCPSVLVVAGTRIEDNVSHWEGGGILAYAGLLPAQPGATVVVERSDVRFNTAAATNGGGGIYHDRTVLTLIDSKVRNNYASDIDQGPNP